MRATYQHRFPGAKYYKRIYFFLFTLLWAGLFHVSTVHAQTARTDVTDQAKQELKTQEEVFRTPTRPASIPIEKKPEITVEEEKKEEIKAKGPVFLLKKIKLEGNQIFSEENFRPFFSQFEGREISFEDLRTIAQLITDYYRAKGYTTSRAFIPPQMIENGTPTIKIVEGKVGKIFVEGNQYFNTKIYTRSIRFGEGQVFRYQDLATNLYFLNQKPDLEAHAYLIAGETPQTSDIIIKAKEKRPMHVSYEFSNRGTKFTHRARHSILLSHNNLLGFSDVLNASLTGAEEGALRAAALQYQFPIEQTRTLLHLNSSISQSQLVQHLKTFEVEGSAFSIIPGITQLFIRTPQWVVETTMAFEIKDSKTEVLGSKISFDRMRVFRIGPQIIHLDRGGQTVLGSDVHVGIPKFLGGSSKSDKNASREGAGGEFVYYTVNALRVQRLPLSSFLIVRGSGQLPKRPLTALEQFRAGGALTVRGYPEGDAAGDYGFNFSSEIRVPPLFIPSDWAIPFIHKRWRDAVHFVGFFDGAKVYNHERITPGAKKDKLLLGVGYGFRVDLDQFAALQLDIGEPVGEGSTDKSRTQIHLSVRAGI